MKIIHSMLLATTCALSSVPVAHATTDALEPLLGEIKWVAFNFAPRGWASCDGQLLSISQNTALFSLLGTIYGGDGRTTFALPDARGRALLHEGNGPGVTLKLLGARGGSELATLSVNQLPAHSHTMNASSARADSAYPHSAVVADTGRKSTYSSAPADVAMHSNSLTTAGGTSGHNNMAPNVTLNCIIATVGIYPSRN